MGQYTVQRGDTLSGIAKRLGLSSYRDLSGYRSGNPNLIYAGEVLNYGGGGGAPAPAPVAAPAAAPRDYLAEARALYNPIFNPTNYDMNYFTEAAKKLYEPVYAPVEAQTTQRYNEAGEKLSTDLMQEYNKRGILNSGVYGETLGKAKTSLESERAAALAKVALDRLGAVNSYATNQYGLQQSNNQAAQELILKYTNEQKRMDDERAQREWENQQAIKQAEAELAIKRSAAAASGGGGSSKTSSKYSYKANYGNDSNGNERKGLTFYGPQGPISAWRWIDEQGGNKDDLADVLSGSSNDDDKMIAQLIRDGASMDQIKSMRPWLFN